MVDIRVVGKLRRFVKEPVAGHASLMQVEPRPDETLQQLLERLEIPVDEIYTIFLNSKLLATRTLIAYRMGYQQAGENPLDWKLEVALEEGDRVGLFGKDMSALVV